MTSRLSIVTESQAVNVAYHEDSKAALYSALYSHQTSLTTNETATDCDIALIMRTSGAWSVEHPLEHRDNLSFRFTSSRCPSCRLQPSGYLRHLQ